MLGIMGIITRNINMKSPRIRKQNVNASKYVVEHVEHWLAAVACFDLLVC